VKSIKWKKIQHKSLQNINIIATFLCIKIPALVILIHRKRKNVAQHLVHGSLCISVSCCVQTNALMKRTQSTVWPMLWFVKPLLVTGILRQTFKQYRLQLVLMYMAWANWKKYVHTSYTSLYTIEKWNVLSFHCTSTFSNCTLWQSYLVCIVHDIVFWTKCMLHIAFVQRSCNTAICETLSKQLFNF